MAKKYCYLFSEGNANMRELLGGKGANLAEMTNIVFLFLRVSPFQPRHAPSIMRMAEKSILRLWLKLKSTS